MKFLYNPPNIIKKIFHEFYWITSNNKILLTFDDGPNPELTVKIMNKLRERDIKALFFCVGENLVHHTELTEMLISEGHVIGNHTIKHKKLTKMSFDESVNEINTLNKLMMDKYDYKIKFFRPPYGRINFKTNELMKSTGMKCVMWSLLTYDYKKGIKKVKFSIDNYLQRNSIVVLHDNIKSENIILETIDHIVDKANHHGYDFGDPEECLK